MQTIGLIGGISWESSAKYYRLLNELTRQRLGGLSSAKLLLLSVDFAEIEHLQRAGAWEELGQLMVRHAQTLQAAGADFLLLCANTMHKVAPEVEAAVQLPLLHIADATAKAVVAQGIRSVGLLGTRFVMSEPFLRERFEQRGIEVILPAPERRAEVDRVIFEELCRGKVLEASRAFFRETMQQMTDVGAQGIVLGCTEFGLLVREDEASVPIFDTTVLHATAAVDRALF